MFSLPPIPITYDCEHQGRDMVEMVAEMSIVGIPTNPDVIAYVLMEFDKAMEPGECPMCSYFEGTYTPKAGYAQWSERNLGYFAQDEVAKLAEAWARSEYKTIGFDLWPWTFIDWDAATPLFVSHVATTPIEVDDDTVVIWVEGWAMRVRDWTKKSHHEHRGFEQW